MAQSFARYLAAQQAGLWGSAGSILPLMVANTGQGIVSIIIHKGCIFQGIVASTDQNPVPIRLTTLVVHRLQIAASIERRILNGVHALGQQNFFYAAAIVERILRNIRNSIRDHQPGYPFPIQIQVVSIA